MFVAFFSSLKTSSIFFLFPFLNFNGPESWSLPEFEHSEKKGTRSSSLESQPSVHFSGLSPTPTQLKPRRLRGAGQGLHCKRICFLFCLSPHLDPGVDSILISEALLFQSLVSMSLNQENANSSAGRGKS